MAGVSVQWKEAEERRMFWKELREAVWSVVRNLVDILFAFGTAALCIAGAVLVAGLVIAALLFLR